MKRRLVLCLPVAALVVTGFWPREPSGDAAEPPGAGRSEPVLALSPLAPALAAPPERNIFAFLDAAPAGHAWQPIEALPAAAAPERVGVRLVGLVRRGDRLLAALAVLGDVRLFGVGDEIEGMRVESVDEDLGVEVRLADGTRLRLDVRP